MLSHNFNISKTSMWVVFNHNMNVNKNPIQKISYSPAINASPTDPNIVEITMKRSLKAAIEELQQEYCQITYDLATAKSAFQIQANKKEMFRKLSIHLGPFHTD